MIDLNKCAKFEIARQCFNDELAFRIRSRRNRLLGLWAAAKLGLSGPEADAYARSIVVLGIERPEDHAAVRHIIRDLCAAGAPCHEHVVLSEMDRLAQVAALEYAAIEPRSQPIAA